MAVNRQEARQRVRQERTDEALEVKEPLENPRIAARFIPVIIALLIGLAFVVLIFVLPNVTR